MTYSKTRAKSLASELYKKAARNIVPPFVSLIKFKNRDFQPRFLRLRIAPTIPARPVPNRTMDIGSGAGTVATFATTPEPPPRRASALIPVRFLTDVLKLTAGWVWEVDFTDSAFLADGAFFDSPNAAKLVTRITC